LSSLPVEGTISARPYHHVHHHEDHGHVRGTPPPRAGTISAPVNDSPESAAVAELGTLISSLGSLSQQAQNMPLTPPSLPALPQSGYRPQATDYTQIIGDAT
jgi:hypothetical protein